MDKKSLHVVAMTQGELAALFAVSQGVLEMYEAQLTREIVADLKSARGKLLQLKSTQAKETMLVA